MCGLRPKPFQGGRAIGPRCGQAERAREVLEDRQVRRAQSRGRPLWTSLVALVGQRACELDGGGVLAVGVEAVLIRCLQGAGVEVPSDLTASRFEGDDALAWPPERLRYHWSIPTLPESEWPRQELPAEVADLLAQRSADLRARDPKD